MSLQDYIAVKEKYAKYLPHSAGRYECPLDTVQLTQRQHIKIKCCYKRGALYCSLVVENQNLFKEKKSYSALNCYTKK